jgi:hypothetical protein
MQEGLSQNNAFVLGWLGRPHGFVPGLPSKAPKIPQRYARGGFGTNNGTIQGLGPAKRLEEAKTLPAHVARPRAGKLTASNKTK